MIKQGGNHYGGPTFLSKWNGGSIDPWEWGLDPWWASQIGLGLGRPLSWGQSYSLIRALPFGTDQHSGIQLDPCYPSACVSQSRQQLLLYNCHADLPQMWGGGGLPMISRIPAFCLRWTVAPRRRLAPLVSQTSQRSLGSAWLGRLLQIRTCAQLAMKSICPQSQRILCCWKKSNRHIIILWNG